MRNRSVPAETVLPHIVYRDLPGAIAWLTSTFGFIEHYRYGEPLSGAQVRLGDAWMMLNAAKPGYRNPSELGFGTQSLTIFVPDVEAHFARTKAAGAKDRRGFARNRLRGAAVRAEDLEGHHWLFSRHARNVSPDAWGATITNPQ